jgi:hypothetical protein
MTTIDRELEYQHEISNWVDEHLSIKFDFNTDNDKWAFSCFDISIEHHSAIICLSSAKLYGSAFALLRVQFEAFIRGLWLRYVATENDLIRFKRDKVKPNFHDLVKSVEEARSINSGLLSTIKNKQWDIFNSFTHTGMEALLRRIGEDTTGYDNYKNEDLINCLKMSGLIFLLCASELAILSEDEEVTYKTVNILQKYKSR